MIKQIAIVVVLLCASTTMGTAQEVGFSMQETDACIAAAEHWIEDETCVGTSAFACARRADETLCYERERAVWEVRMDKNYKGAFAREEADDARDIETGWAYRGQALALKNMHEAWVAYRDAECAYHGKTWPTDKTAKPGVTFCLMKLTGKQALKLGELWGRDY